MGQRHQILIVAKVRNRHRFLAGLHYHWPNKHAPKWLYRVGPIKVCLRLLSIFESKANSIPLTQELRAASELHDDLWTKHSNVEVFPYITTCLAVGCSFIPGAPDLVSVAHWDFPFSDDLNFDIDMTVIEISHLGHLRYCLPKVFYGAPDVSGFSEFPVWYPLSAGQYAGQYLSYYSQLRKPEDTDSKDPDGEGFKSPSQDDGMAKRLDGYNLLRKAVLQRDKRVHVKSLRETALDSFFACVMDGGELELNDLAEVRQLPDFAQKIRKRLVTRARNNGILSLANSLILLELALSGNTHIDSSAFCGLTAECLTEAMFRILRNNHVRSIDLSHLTQLSEADVNKILDAASDLKRLYLLQMPQVSTEFVFHPNEIYHADLLRLPFTDPESFFITNLRSALQAPHLAIGQNSPVKYVLFARVITNDETPILRKDGGTAIDWGSYKLSLDLEYQEQPQSGQMHQMICPLHDINLHPHKLVARLANFIFSASKDRRATYGLPDTNSLGSTMANSFATGASSTEIPHLPGMLSNIANSLAMMAGFLTTYWPVPFPNAKVQPKKTDKNTTEATSMLQMERSQLADHERFRLAVITPKTDDGNKSYRVECMESFLKNVMGKELGTDVMDITKAMDYWKGQVGFVEKCAVDEMHDLAPALERNSEIVMQSEGMQLIEEEERDDEYARINQVFDFDSDEISEA
ncbi:MAG: hypothetical protein Q9218_004923 [Villophora microphyllina]